MSAQRKPSSPSDQRRPPLDPPSSSGARMAATQLTPIGPHHLGTPSSMAYPVRPVLPPLPLRASLRPDPVQYSSYPRSLGLAEPQIPTLEAHRRGVQQPTNIPWHIMPPVEQPPRSSLGNPLKLHSPSGALYVASRDAARPLSDRRSSAETMSEVPPTPTSFGRNYRPIADEESRYSYAPLTEQPGRRDSGSSYRGSVTSSSPYGSALSYTSQPQILTVFQQSPQDITSRYILRVRQQPVAARACGFGERDRRVIDPPPIVQLSLAGYDPMSPADVAELKTSFLVVHCTLLSVSARPSPYEQGEDVTAIPEPNNIERITRRLTGTLVASPFAGMDLDAPASRNDAARLGCFFVFSDLSCRQVGRYRLRFQIMKIGPEILDVGGRTSVVRSVESDVFEVFSAKDFPGMRASTALTKDLKRQGAAVSVKKGNEGSARQGNKKRGSTASDRSASNEPGEPSAKTRGKPRKTKK